MQVLWWQSFTDIFHMPSSWFIYCFNVLTLLVRVLELWCTETSYFFYHFDGWKFKFALKYAVDCLVTFDNYKCNILFLRIRIYPSFTSNEICRALLIFKKSVWRLVIIFIDFEPKQSREKAQNVYRSKLQTMNRTLFKATVINSNFF